MATKKKTAAKKPVKRAAAPAKAPAKKKAAGASAKSAARATGGGDVVYTDVLRELRSSLVSRLIR